MAQLIVHAPDFGATTLQMAMITYRIKPEGLSILSCEKGPRPKAEAFFAAKNGEPLRVLTTSSTPDDNEIPSYSTARSDLTDHSTIRPIPW